MSGEWLVLINTVFNYLLLLFIRNISNVPMQKRRAFMAALSSAVISTLLTPSLLSSILSMTVLVFLSFTWQLRTFMKQLAILIGATIFLGGLLTAVQPYLAGRTLIFYTILCIILAIVSSKWGEMKWRYFWQQKIQGNYVVTCRLAFVGTPLTLRGFIDTGNMCTEPISQQPVHFISYRMIKEQLPANINMAIQSWDSDKPYNLTMFPVEWLASIRLIPLTTMNKKTIALAFRLTQWTIDDKEVVGHYVVLTKNDQYFPQQAHMMLHVLALST